MRTFTKKNLLILAALFLAGVIGALVYQNNHKVQNNIAKATPINYSGSTILKEFNQTDIDKYQTAAGTYNIATMASNVTSILVDAFSNATTKPLPLVANWNTGIPEYQNGLDPMYMINKLANGEHVLPSWKLDPYYNNNIGQSYYEASIKKAAELGLPLVFILPSPESALTNDDVYFTMNEANNPNVITTDGTILPKLSPFGPNSLWYEVGGQWSTTSLMAQIQEWYPNPPLILFVDEDASNKLSWNELSSSSRYTSEYPTDKSDEFKKTLVNAKWIEKYRQLHKGFKDGFIKTAWKNNVKFVGRNQLAANMGATADWANNATTTNLHANIWPYTTDALTVDFDLDGNKTDSSQNAPHITANNLPFMLEEAKTINPNFNYQLSINANGKIDNPQRYRGYTQFALWFLRPSVIRQETAATSQEDISPLFQEVIDSVELINYNEVLADFWKNGKLVETGTSPLNKNIPTQYNTIPKWFLLDTDAQQTIWAFALVKGEAPNREWLVYAQSPDGNLTNISVTVPEYANVELNSTQEGMFNTFSESNTSQVTIKSLSQPTTNTSTISTTKEVNLINQSNFKSLTGWLQYRDGIRTNKLLNNETGLITFKKVGDRLFSPLIKVDKGLCKVGLSIKNKGTIPDNLSLQIGLYDADKHFIKNDIHSTSISNSKVDIWENIGLFLNVSNNVKYIQVKLSLYQYMENLDTADISIDNLYVYNNPKIDKIPERKPFNGKFTQIDKYGNIKTMQNGSLEPFFPLCIYNDKHRDLKVYSEQGFNCVAWSSWYGAIEEGKKATSIFNPNGMKVAFDISGYISKSRSSYRNFDNLKENINKISSLGLDNNLLWYYWDNEHMYNSWTDPIDTINIVKNSDKDKNGSAKHPIYALNGTIGIANKYNNLIDMTGTYLVWDSESVNDNTDAFLSMQHIPSISSPVVMAQINLGLSSVQGVGSRMRPVVYKAIIQGAKGIGYWKDKPKEYYPKSDWYGDITQQTWWSDFPNIRREIDILLKNGIIQAPPTDSSTVSTNAEGIELGFKEVNGKKYILVANMNNNLQEVIISLKNITLNNNTVYDLFTKKQVSIVENNSIKLSIPSYGTYVLFLQ